MSSNNSSFKVNKEKNAPSTLTKSVHNNELGHQITTRKYITRNQIDEITRNKYHSNGSGITFQDIMIKFRVTKSRAQRTLKHFHMKKVLFTAEDLRKQEISFKGFKRSSPQRYYLTEMRSKIIDDNKRNVQIDTTDTNHIEKGKIQTFLSILEQLDSSFLYIHKLQLKTRISKEHCNELDLPKKGNNNDKGTIIKYRKERINQSHGKPDIEFNIFSNGTIMIYISCSDNPFRLFDDDDVSKILAYLGRVEDRLKSILSDTRNSIVPSSLTWILSGCDVNKDIQIDDDSMAQLTSINIQIKSAIGVFRAYVKQTKDNKSVYRNENSMTPNEPVSTAFETIRKSVKIDKNSLSLK